MKKWLLIVIIIAIIILIIAAFLVYNKVFTGNASSNDYGVFDAGKLGDATKTNVFADVNTNPFVEENG